MSLLLEALKKAALEKQNRESSSGSVDPTLSPNVDAPLDSTPKKPNLGDTLRHDDDIAPVQGSVKSKGQASTIHESNVEQAKATPSVAQSSDILQQETAHEEIVQDDPLENEATQNAVESITSSDAVVDEAYMDEDWQIQTPEESQELEDLENLGNHEAVKNADREPLDTEEHLTFEPEFDFEDESDTEPTSSPINAATQIDTLPSTDQQLDLTSTLEQDMFDEIAQEEERLKIEQERLLEEEVAKQQQQLEEERLQIERQIEEQEEQKKQQAEAAENERKQAAKTAEKNRLAEENKDALDQLIASGKEIHKQERRRSAFLYIMLIVTGLGGMLAYYLFLIANTEKSELQAAPIVMDNSDIADVAAMIQSAESNEPITLDENNVVSEPPGGSLIATTQHSASVNGGEQLLSNTTTTGGITTEVEYLAPSASPSDAASLDNTSGSGRAATETLISTSSGTNLAEPSPASRVDPPPSIAAYLHPLILAADGSAQTESVAERVIIHHKAEPTKINDLIKAGYRALKSNEFEKADRFYRNALALEPGQRDAVLGAAATATAMGRFDEATTLYQRRLQDDPKDAYAHAGLLGLATDSSSRQGVQREVNQLLNQYPDSAHLHFLKGVGLAASSQWQAAQSAFYESYRRDSKNPDYAFNLAVALDHLRQPSLARVYYERAIELSREQGAGFDLNAALLRLKELSQP